MKQNNTLTLLALLTASLLTACSSGGGNAPEPMPQPAPEQPGEQQKENGGQENQQPPGTGQEGNADKQPEPPIKPKPEQPDSQSFEDKEVLKRLSVSDSEKGLLTGLPLTLSLDDGTKKIMLNLPQPHQFQGTPFVETLRDSEGTLIGYYANATINEISDDINNKGEKVNKLTNYFLHSVDDSLKQRPGLAGDVAYKGTMVYQYNNVLNGSLKANVEANYSGRDKTLSMKISDANGGVWNLHREKTLRTINGQKEIARISVGDDGSVGGKLLYTGVDGHQNVYNGDFTGGFYGKNGSVLTGTAEYRDSDLAKAWKGVIGAAAVPEK